MEWITTIDTKSGGSIDLGIINHRFDGLQAVIHIDQTSNVNNGEDEASIVISYNEIKTLQENLVEFLKFLESRGVNG